MENMLNKLSAAVSFYFKDDAIRPGVVISTLRNNSVYASVVRYNNAWVKGKKVVCNVTAPSLDGAISLLSKRFVEYMAEEQATTNPVEILKKAIIYR